MPSTLPEEIIEKIFLRLPPDEPAWLVRASLASKLWLSLLSGHKFRAAYLDLHGATPMLGFLYSLYECDGLPPAPEFVPTTKFRMRIPDGFWSALDCRHGRALLEAKGKLIVWDPMTGCQRELNRPPRKYTCIGNDSFTVLCATSGCDHRDCHEGPFWVVFLGLRAHPVRDHSVALACVFSSETGEWSKRCSKLNLESNAGIESSPTVLLEDALYILFGYDDSMDPEILKYDLGSNCLSLVDAPVLEDDVEVGSNAPIILAMEDGSLGLALMDGLTLYLWSRKIASDKAASWTELRFINLKNLLPTDNPMEKLSLNGAIEGSDIIFVTGSLGVYELNIKSLQLKKLWNEIEHFYLYPYMSFYHPQPQGRGRQDQQPEG